MIVTGEPNSVERFNQQEDTAVTPRPVPSPSASDLQALGLAGLRSLVTTLEQVSAGASVHGASVHGDTKTKIGRRRLWAWPKIKLCLFLFLVKKLCDCIILLAAVAQENASSVCTFVNTIRKTRIGFVHA